MPPMIPATASKSSLSFTVNTASTCITRCFSSKPKLAVCSPPSFAPATPRPQPASPLRLSGWFLSLSNVSLTPRSAIEPMPARPLQRSTGPWSPVKCSIPSASPPTRYSRKELSAGFERPGANTPVPKLRCDSSIAFATGPEAGTRDDALWSKSKSALWGPISALSLPTVPVESNRSITTMMSEESARIGSRNLSAILAPIGFPVIAIALIPFDFNSMRSLTSCWCSFAFIPCDKLNSLTLGWRPYDLSCSKSERALYAALATSGFISPQAGPDAICSWRSGENLSASPSLHPVSRIKLNLQPDSQDSQRSDAQVFSQNAFFPSKKPQTSNIGPLGLEIYIRSKLSAINATI